MTTTRIRTYSELKRLETFSERFRYLALHGDVGDPTFGTERWINQEFYRSNQWKQIRWEVIARDSGWDLGIPDREITDRIIVHHMNPMVVEDIVQGESNILDPEFLITTTHLTHNAIHYGDERMLPKPFVPRRPGDTKLW